METRAHKYRFEGSSGVIMLLNFMDKLNKIIIIFIFSLFLIGGFSSVSAQLVESDISLSINPSFPAPFQNTKATLSTHSIDLDKSYIVWTLDGQEVFSGIGKKTYSFTTSGGGISSTLTASISTVKGQNIIKTILIVPSEVDMLWEAVDSYAPPFYKGKILGAKQSTYKVVAMPNMSGAEGNINEKNLSYTWSKDDNVQLYASGWGKNYFIFSSSFLDKDNKVDVKVSDVLGTKNSSGKILIKPNDPEIIFYKKNKELGIMWEKALENGASLEESGSILVAEPYFFSPKNIDLSQLEFTWSINNSLIDTPSPKNIIALKKEEGKSGSAIIKLTIENINTLFQKLSREINMVF